MVSGGAGFIGVFGRIVRPRRALRAAFVRKVSRIFQVAYGSPASSIALSASSAASLTG